MGLKKLERREADVEHQREKLQAKKGRLGDRIEDLKDERQQTGKQVSKKKKQEAKLEAKIAKERASKLDTRTCIDGATTWVGLALVILDVRENTPWNGVANAADRTSHADDCGNKSSQAELWHLFQAGRGNPANPPGSSSHEGVNGGNGGTPVTSAVPVGADLPWYRWGLDLSDGDTFVREAGKLGYKVSRPHMPREPWHINLTANPKAVLQNRGRI